MSLTRYLLIVLFVIFFPTVGWFYVLAFDPTADLGAKFFVTVLLCLWFAAWWGIMEDTSV